MKRPAPSQVMILCAGHGVRLAPLTGECPKPLLPIGDRPQLAHLFDALVAQGITRVVINTHHLSEAFARLDTSRLSVHVSHEPALLGTAGALAHAREHLATPLVVWNGDILATPRLGALFDAVRAGGVALLSSPVRAGAGTLGLDEVGRVVRLRGERFGEEVRAADYLGVLALGADALDRVPERGCLIGDVCLPWLRSGRPIGALAHDGDWVDIGSLSAYQLANLRWLEQNGAPFHVGPGAVVAPGVALVDSVVSPGASVEGEGSLERCVVLPGARVNAPLCDAIVMASGEVVRVAARASA